MRSFSRLKVGMLVGFLVCLMGVPVALGASPFSDPGIPDGETLHYRFQTGDYASDYLVDVKKREEVVESVHRIWVDVDERGAKTYRLEDTGSRRSGQRFENVSVIRVGDDGVEPVRFRTQDRTSEGRLIRRF